MKDMVTNGTGNSRYLKTSLASGTTWESALAMLREGTFPIDLNGLNNGGITQLGSAYSKANVLPDDVCALLGLDSTTAEPKDAFNVVGNPAELWVWEKFAHKAAYADLGPALGSRVLIYTDYTYSSYYVNFRYSNSVSVASDGTLSLVNPSTVKIYKTSATAQVGADTLIGKYFTYDNGTADSSFSYDDGIYYWPTNATLDYTTTSGTIYVIGVKSVIGVPEKVASREEHISYESAADSTAYPVDGRSGDYWYIRLGQIGEGMTKIETGSYVGTGTYGSSNPNSLTFGFAPKLVALVIIGDGEERYPGPKATDIIPVMSFKNDDVYRYGGLDDPNQSRGKTKLSIDGKTITWYSTSDNYQCNGKDYVYYYLAIG